MKLKIGTRGSQLALIQTEMLSTALKRVNEKIEIEVVTIKTLGDRKQGTSQASNSDKKDWIIDLELALLNDDIDLAIHSGKDVPGNIEPGTEISSVLKRANPHDAFIGSLDPSTKKRVKFVELGEGAVVGTASLRRQAALKRLRPDLCVREHRGNVQTRLDKLDSSDEIKGIVLACAGLDRLGFSDLIYEQLDSGKMLPALNQGTLAVQYRVEREDIREICSTITDAATQAAFLAERGCAEKIGGDCQSAIGIFAKEIEAKIVGDKESRELSISACVMSHDGARVVEASKAGRLDSAAELGQKLGEELLSAGAGELLEECSRAGDRI